ncbi:MAG TPA: metallophosphoesterase [Polyangiaceae bacterium]|jgi:3',5'-cyclic AMP phosphodiesterase CpdA
MRIAHFSDLHVLSLEGIGPGRFLNKRITGYANLRLKRGHVHRPAYVRAIAREIKRCAVEHVVVTGDLTNLALEPEFEAVRRMLEEELGLSPRDVSIVPGNHDLYTRGALTTKRFAKYFHAYMDGDLPELGVDVGPGRFPFVRLRGPAAIIGLSSAVPRLPFFAAGRLGTAQLDALAKVLEHPEVRSRTPVVLVHHPAHNPLSRIATLLRGLDDAALLWTTVRDVPRGLLLHGHLHQRIQRPLATSRGHMQSVGATSASLEHEDAARMAGFNVYEIDAGGAVKRIEAHVFDPARDRFDVQSVPKLVEHVAVRR